MNFHKIIWFLFKHSSTPLWEATIDIQSQDVLLVQIDENLLKPNRKLTSDVRSRHDSVAVYQVTRLGHEKCDITEGELLDITPISVGDKRLVTLYDKDLTEGANLLLGKYQHFFTKQEVYIYRF